MRVAFCVALAAALGAFAVVNARQSPRAVPTDPHADRTAAFNDMMALNAAVAAACACAIDGVAIDNRSVRTGWRIDFHGSKGWGDTGDATPTQIAAANAELRSFMFP